MATETFYFNCLLIASLVGCLICQENIATENATLSQETIIAENVSETSLNSTINNDELPAEIEESANQTQKFVNCLTGMGDSVVQITNDTELFKLLQSNVNVTNREIPSLCVVVMFYKKYCPFSALAAPHYNALPRAFPDIKMVAINAVIFHMLNTQNGIVGVPSLMLFHNGRSIAKYNGTEYTLELFSQFITRHTGIAAAEKSTVTSADFAGPVKTIPLKDYDIFLIISWLFVIMCGGYYFTKSRWWKWIIESIQSNWRESEAHAQHEHAE